MPPYTQQYADSQSFDFYGPPTQADADLLNKGGTPDGFYTNGTQGFQVSNGTPTQTYGPQITHDVQLVPQTWRGTTQQATSRYGLLVAGVVVAAALLLRRR